MEILFRIVNTNQIIIRIYFGRTSDSLYSAIPEVREKLVEIQRKMGMRKSVIMDGRDIGTNVFRDAEYKIFLTASAKERAERRFD